MTKMLLADDEDLLDGPGQLRVIRTGSRDAECLAELARSRAVDAIAVQEARFQGVEVVSHLRHLAAETDVLVLSRVPSIAAAVESVSRGAVNYLPSPASSEQVLTAIRGDVLRRGTRPLTLARLEWEYVRRVLLRCNGNVSEAARRHGIHRQSLQRKLRASPPPSAVRSTW